MSFFEVLHLEPYNQKQSDRGRVWRVIAENLNTNTQHDFLLRAIPAFTEKNFATALNSQDARASKSFENGA